MCGYGDVAVTPAFLIAAGYVVVRFDAMAMSGAEFAGDPLESDGVHELKDAALKFLLVCGG